MSRRPEPPRRALDDACPGVLRLREAADGHLARVRLVGGFLSAQGLSALAELADELGDGRVELTSRGNVQLRGLPADAGAELGRRLHAVGLWPSATHERVRNIMASPLAGLDGSPALFATVHALDAGLCAEPRLADLSGRFLFAVDDGRGDVAGLRPDVLIQAGAINGLPVSDPVAAALLAAHAFLDERQAQRSTAWRVTDLIDGASRVRARLARRLGGDRIERPFVGDAPRPGPFRRPDGPTALVLAVPLGRLSSDQLRWLAAQVQDEPARITPWRTVVLPSVENTAAAEQRGFGVAPDTAWALVSACAGRPGCAKALADVQTDARAALHRWPDQVVHWSGCDRRCGRPTTTEVDVIGTESGYRIEGNSDA